MAENQPGPVKRPNENRMSNESPFSSYAAGLRELIRGTSRRAPGSKDVQETPGGLSFSSLTSLSSLKTGDVPGSKTTSKDVRDVEFVGRLSRFDELALELFALQFERLSVYRRFCQARGVTPETISAWVDIPAVPTAAFKEFEFTSLSPVERTVVFHSSGTTTHRTSCHFHSQDSIELYEASALGWFQQHLLPDADSLTARGAKEKRLPFLMLTPPSVQAPNSSLVHMFETIRREFAADDSAFVGQLVTPGEWTVDRTKAWVWLSNAAMRNQPVVLLGTAFGFVELLDWMAEKDLHVQLASGSRALETGGYKGRTRALPKEELHSLMTERLGIPSTRIVSEYGMSELSSQAYDRVADVEKSPIANRKSQIDRRLFRFPPWARLQIVSPETGREVAEGETGLIRVFDLANVRSVLAIQTEDLGVRRAEGFELLGRAAFAEPKGCSLMTAS